MAGAQAQAEGLALESGPRSEAGEPNGARIERQQRRFVETGASLLFERTFMASHKKHDPSDLDDALEHIVYEAWKYKQSVHISRGL
jgi:hypothetical protein